MGTFEESPFNSEFKLLENDPDLPDNTEGGFFTSCAAQFNPGQLVLAMAEQVQQLGGRIVTSCKVEGVTTPEELEGRLKLACSMNG